MAADRPPRIPATAWLSAGGAGETVPGATSAATDAGPLALSVPTRFLGDLPDGLLFRLTFSSGTDAGG